MGRIYFLTWNTWQGAPALAATHTPGKRTGGVLRHLVLALAVLLDLLRIGGDDRRQGLQRDTPPEPFVNESIEELGTYRAVLDTGEGPITIEFFTDKAPNTVRQFMRMAAAGVYNGMSFHRVAPGFVIQTGAEGTRGVPFTEKQKALVHELPPEFNDTKHVKGIVSMARGDDPAITSPASISCLSSSRSLRRSRDVWYR